MTRNAHTDPFMERKLGQIQVGEKKITTVAFEAIKTENQGGPGCSSSSYLCNRGPITFTTVRINLGQGFLDNGTFVAPSEGIYHFEVSLIAQQDAQLVMKTTRSNQMFRLYDRIYRGRYERTITKTATLKMEKGDGIYVENESSDTDSVWTDTMYPLTFKGFKIK